MKVGYDATLDSLYTDFVSLKLFAFTHITSDDLADEFEPGDKLSFNAPTVEDKEMRSCYEGKTLFVMKSFFSFLGSESHFFLAILAASCGPMVPLFMSGIYSITN